MYETTRALIDALGGYRMVAKRLGMGATTLHGYITEGALPAKWYTAFLELAAERCIEPPSRKLFSFEKLSPPRASQRAPQEDAA